MQVFFVTHQPEAFRSVRLFPARFRHPFHPALDLPGTACVAASCGAFTDPIRCMKPTPPLILRATPTREAPRPKTERAVCSSQRLILECGSQELHCRIGPVIMMTMIPI